MNIQFVNIEGALDKDKLILADGVKVGEVSRSWLRLGGEQWVVGWSRGPAFGAKTLKELKGTIAHQLNR